MANPLDFDTPITGKVIIMRDGGILEEKELKATSLSMKWGDTGWALPSKLYRLPTHPRKYKSLAEYREARRKHHAHVSLVSGYSEATAIIREGDIRAVPVGADNWVHPLKAFQQLSTWDAITDKRAEQVADDKVTGHLPTSLVIGASVSTVVALALAGLMWAFNQGIRTLW